MMRTVAVRGASLEVAEWGAGEPVVFVQTTLTADELRPVATDAALEGHRRILYHRRGYAGSSPATPDPASIARDAADCGALLEALDVGRAHVVGLSFSGAIAMQLAADRPELVHSLTLIEPPPTHIPSVDEFRAVNDELLALRRAQGIEAAFEEFMQILVGPDWEEASEERLPGSVEQMREDAGTFFDVDLAGLFGWEFGEEDADRIACPVLYVGGTDSGAWWVEVRELMLEWFPHADDAVIDGADHWLALTHAPQIAAVLADFLRRHPMDQD
ncbi:MAG: alpha/beta hydrolase [Nitriliruptorales bacterium]|nr:alpha/beta hydrolase [Nitriliruptorales bacterium]